MMNITKLTAWKKLQKHYKKIKNCHLRELFADDSKRFDRFSLQVNDIFLDYSKNRITTETLELLIQLAEEAGMKEKIRAMFAGKKINTTEHRAVLHTALRNHSHSAVMVGGEDVMQQIQVVLSKMRHFIHQVHSGEWTSQTGKKITDIINIGIGGSDLGPKMACFALSKYAQNNLKAHFISNIDGTAIAETLKNLNPETTLFIIASKTFTTLETLTNAETAKNWLVKKLNSKEAVAKHFVAVSTNTEKVKAFGIDPNNMFEFWNFVGGRYSVWSAIGLSLALLIGMDQFEEFLAGAAQMDEHFKTAPYTDNMPILLGLLDIWYRNFFGFASHAIVPYDQCLQYLPAFLQQLDMESNGKSVRIDGNPVSTQTGPVIWGGIGIDCQHSFHQLLHQGTDIIPVDFIVAKESLNPMGKHHDLLVSNCFAQSQALLQGKTYDEAYQELLDKGYEQDAKQLAHHKFMPGNRPSNTFILKKLTPHSLGALIALYEHKVFVEGILWQINSFDQWGVELGKQLANKITPYLTENKKMESADSSTQGLIQHYQKDLLFFNLGTGLA